MPLESIQEQVLQAFVALFGGLVTDGGMTVNYTVDRCLRVTAFSSECLDESFANAIYAVSPDETPINLETLGQSDARMQFDISLAKKLSAETENPFNPPAEDRLLIQNRLIQDATRAINKDPSLGLRSVGVMTTYIRHENRRAQDTYVDNWVIAFLRVEVQAVYADGAP